MVNNESYRTDCDHGFVHVKSPAGGMAGTNFRRYFFILLRFIFSVIRFASETAKLQF